MQRPCPRSRRVHDASLLANPQPQKRTETNKRPSASSSASQKRAETKKTPLALDSEAPARGNLAVELQTRRSSNPSSVSGVLPWSPVAPCLCVLLRRGLLCGCPVVRIVSGELIASTGSSGSNVISYTSELPSTLECRIVCAFFAALSPSLPYWSS